MKKHIFTFFIFLICLVFAYFNIQKPNQYKVIEIGESYDVACVDTNLNSKCDKDEYVKLYGIKPFPSKFGSGTKYIQERYNIKEEDSVVLSVLAKDFAKKNLINKYVTFEILNENSSDKYKIGKIYLENNEFSLTMLKNGWATATDDDYLAILTSKSLLQLLQ